MSLPDPIRRFAGYVQTLGRGPGRSRALTAAEAEDAFGLVLEGAVAPEQLGAFLMLLRYRGEDVAEISGLVRAARRAGGFGAGGGGAVDLDWPSYGAGRTRGAPWFLLSALALAQAGVRVLMHGSNEFSSGVTVAAALEALGLPVARGLDAASAHLDARNFAYIHLADLLPGLDRLLGLRALFGLRSPVNTVARLVNPLAAPAGVDGVFHPPYINLHLGVAAALGQPSLLVVKGGGGEAERSPLKPMTAYRMSGVAGRQEFSLPALAERAEPVPGDAAACAALWSGEWADPVAVATVVGTIALALLALGRVPDAAAADVEAGRIWAGRF